jgi:putative tricarboxylic transport membrane protein
MPDILTVLSNLFSISSILAILGGICGGLVVGFLPGLTSNMAIALLLPITFAMPPIPSLLMLVSVYAAAIYSGSFSAILLHTPGTSASAATVLDGFPLTQRGESNKALRVATFSSMFGGAFSALALLLLAPPLSRISLMFGPAEYFFVAIFGLSIIGSLSSGSVVKGLLSGALGLLFSTVGLDLDSGFPRFCFGYNDLHAGLEFVPAVIGLFSMSQALVMAEEVHKSIQRIETPAGSEWRVFPRMAEIREIKTTLLRSSFLGVLVGILPGAGGDISSWVGYNEAKRFSKHPERFGTGALEGIAASETANNANTGGALIPMLTLGIPGSPSAAVLLGALVIQGLVPGHEIFDRYGHIVYTVIVGFFLANILMGLMGMYATRYLSHITTLPNYAVIPVIIFFSVVGSYSLGHSMLNVMIMLSFGFMGFLMRKIDMSPAPMILGMILGPFAEKGFRQALTLSRGDMFPYLLKSPISLTLIVLTILSVATTVYLNSRKGKKTALPPGGSTPQAKKD